MLNKKNIYIFNLLKVTETLFYLYGSFGSQFISVSKLYFSEIVNNYSLYAISNQYHFFFNNLISLKCGWKVKLKIVGRGFSFFKRKFFVYMNIGRSHIVRFFLNNYIRIICHKKHMTLIAMNFNYLRKISLMLITAQPPLQYKIKGLIYQFYNYNVKPGKIKQYRV